MTDVPTSGRAANLPATSGSGVQLELLMTLDLFGLRADASATFGPGRDTVLAVRLGDRSLSELIPSLVDYAETGLDFQSPAPWDVLNTIKLHAFTFEVDLT